jgi:hypothetical protein
LICILCPRAVPGCEYADFDIEWRLDKPNASRWHRSIREPSAHERNRVAPFHEKRDKKMTLHQDDVRAPLLNVLQYGRSTRVVDVWVGMKEHMRCIPELLFRQSILDLRSSVNYRYYSVFVKFLARELGIAQTNGYLGSDQEIDLACRYP